MTALERVKGIEPSSVAWEATALPLSYTRDDDGHPRIFPILDRLGGDKERAGPVRAGAGFGRAFSTITKMLEILARADSKDAKTRSP